MNPRRSRQRGAALAIAVICLSVLILVFGVLSRIALTERGQTRAEERRLRAGWLAESGLERAWVKLAASPDYMGETWNLAAESLRGRDSAVVRISVEPIPGDPRRIRITSRADYPREGTSRVRQTRTAVFPAKHSTNPGAHP